MSDSGVYSGIYSTVRDVAELVDSVLLDIKAVPGVPDPDRQRLSRLLASTAEDDQGSIVSTVLRILLRDAAQPTLNPARIARELLSQNPAPEAVHGLELLATILEKERVEMLSKMGAR